MESPEAQTALLVMLFGGVIVVALLTKGGLRRVGVPAMVGYLVLGVALRVLDDRLDLLGQRGHEVFGFLATLGVITLLFRVGLESDLPGLLGQLRSASLIWAGNVLVAGLAGYVTARHLLNLPFVPSLVVATAMTATSVGIPARVWRSNDALTTRAGERFLDVAEMDDLSGVLLMGLLFAALPALRGQASETGVGTVVAREGGLFVAKLIVFAGLCVLFSRYAEKRVTRTIRRFESDPDPMLIVVGIGLLVAAAAGALGFSVAIGAFFAGLVFSRDPQSVKVDAKFAPLYDLFSPFFFVGVGLEMNPQVMLPALGVGGALLAAAVVGKLVGTSGPSLLCAKGPEAVTLGASMVPRAEITMLIMHRAHAMGPEVAPATVYGGMVLVSAATCLGTPPLLHWMIRRWILPGQDDKQDG